jgi:hypothetical protein
MMKIGFVGAASLACMMVVSGCSGAPSSGQVAPGTLAPSNATIRNDPASPVIEVSTAAGTDEHKSGGGESVRLIGKIDRNSGRQEIFAQWGDVYSADTWRDYSTASNDRGTPYRMVQLEHSSSDCYAYRCTYTEVYDITIPAEDARLAATGGLEFKMVSARGTERRVTIAASAMAAFDARMAEAAKLVGK